MSVMAILFHYFGLAPFVFLIIIIGLFILQRRILNGEIHKLRKRCLELSSENRNQEIKNKEERTSLLNEEKEKLALLEQKYNLLLSENRSNEHRCHMLEEKLLSTEKELENRNEYFKIIMTDNLEAMPYLAGLMSDYLTYDFEVLAKQIDWGYDGKRLKKVKDIREIRRDAREMIEIAKTSQYQLEYLKQLYPEIEEIIDTKYDELPRYDSLASCVDEYDRARNYLSGDEWNTMSESEKNQLALDRYIESHQKSKWQIGRDYELYVGYSMYEQNNYQVSYFGSEMRLNDLGRDLIIEKEDEIDIVQCKYWSKDKVIHEKHIFQLFGTCVGYKFEHRTRKEIRPVFVTNIQLSDQARAVAKYLNVTVYENYSMGEFPRIKCNVNRDEFGCETRIYHLPMDQQYDSVKIDAKKGEFFAMTVHEAEEFGFRRAYKWYGN